jgi:hypothetical protein
MGAPMCLHYSSAEAMYWFELPGVWLQHLAMAPVLCMLKLRFQLGIHCVRGDTASKAVVVCLAIVMPEAVGSDNLKHCCLLLTLMRLQCTAGLLSEQQQCLDYSLGMCLLCCMVTSVCQSTDVPSFRH